MSVSEAEGLKKLIEFMNQTKRQAEAAIDIMNEKIRYLSASTEPYTHH